MKKLTSTAMTAVLILTTGILASSCTTTKEPVAIRHQYPILPMVARPALENISAEEFEKLNEPTRVTLNTNFGKLLQYATTLEEIIVKYNEFAAEKNKQNGITEE